MRHFLALLLLMWGLPALAQQYILATTVPMTYGGGGGGGGAPAAAVAVGYNTLTYSTTTFSSTNVDTGNTHASGLQWYAFNGDGVVPPGCSTAYAACTVTDLSFPGDGSIQFAGANDSEISTAAAKSSLTDFVGTAFGGGALFRVVMSYAVGSWSNGAGGIPAYWFQTLEYTWLKATTTCTLLEMTGTLSPHCAAWPSTGTSNWGGQSAGFEHQIEDDAMEYAAAQLGAALHESYGTYGSTCTPGFCQLSTSSGQMPKYAIGSANVSQQHTYDRLWVPATATSQGYTAYYFDGSLMNASPSWSLFKETNVAPYLPSNYPPTVTCASLGGSGSPNCLGATSPASVFGVIDTLHSVPILGCGSGGNTNGGCPMFIYSFQVWQASNQHNVVK